MDVWTHIRYVNKSAIHRLILHPDGGYPAQFRNATILFVSLGNVKPWISEGLSFCQRAMIIVHEITSTYEGTFMCLPYYSLYTTTSKHLLTLSFLTYFRVYPTICRG
jgi:hypothetical protein